MVEEHVNGVDVDSAAVAHRRDGLSEKDVRKQYLDTAKYFRAKQVCF